jgi:integrase/recombinase XerD
MAKSIIPISKDMAIQSIKPNIKVEFFTDLELDQIFEYIQNKINTDSMKKNYHKRYLLLFKTLLRTGGRIDEILQLRPCDFNLNINTVSLITLKKKFYTTRTIPLHPDLKDAIMTYFLEFNINPKSSELLFKVKRQSVDEYMKKMQNELGIKIHAHKFRHTFAVNAILAHVPLNILQNWLGHSSVFTTSIYTEITGYDTSKFMNEIP